MRVRASVVVVAALTISACTGDAIVADRSESSSSLSDWQKDPGKLGQRWRQAVAGQLELVGATVGVDRVYVATKSAVVALDVQTGDELWRVDLAGVVRAPVVVAERVLVAASDGDQLVALDAITGEQKWSADAFSFGTNGTAAVVTDADGVVALNAADGRQLWRMPRPPIGETTIEGPVLSDGNLVFVHTELPSEVIALDARTGAEVWRQPVRASRETPRFFAAAGLVLLAEAGGEDDKPVELVALDAATGAAKWEITLGAPTLAPPVRVDDVVLFSTGKGVRAVQISDGRERFAALEEYEYPSISSCGETACVLYASLQLVDAQGQVVQEITPPAVSTVPAASFLNVIVVTDSEGTVTRYR